MKVTVRFPARHPRFSMKYEPVILIRKTPEDIALELRLLIEQLHELSTFVTCDHGNNYVQLSGRIDKDKQTMLAKINTFFALPEREREAHYLAVGSRI